MSVETELVPSEIENMKTMKIDDTTPISIEVILLKIYCFIIKLVLKKTEHTSHLVERATGSEDSIIKVY